MIESILSLISQNALFVGIGVWLVIAFGNSKERDTFMEKTWKLLTAPSELQDYSEEWLDRAETGFRNALVNPVSDFLKWLIDSVKGLWQVHQWKLLGQLITLLFLMFFFVPDAIVITGVLDVMGFPIDLPESAQNFLGQYGVAIAAGTFFSVIVSGFVLFEVFGRSEFSDFGTYPDGLKKTVRVAAIALILSSLICGISLGFVAWKVTGQIPAWLSWTDSLVQFSINVLVRANVLIATALILLEALKGSRSLVSVLLAIGVLVFGAIFIFVSVLANFGRLLFDWIGKLFRWILWLISFLVFAPLDIMVSSPKNLIEFLMSLFGKGHRNGSK